MNVNLESGFADDKTIKALFHNSVILITGGTGSWGQELTRRLLSFEPKEIRIFSRGEFNQVQMARSFDNHPALQFIIGDVRDYESVWQACDKVDYIFHLAALKHVPICEKQPEEAMKTNVLGTQHIIRASIARGVKKVIDVSTDKAVNPVNFYGMTKLYGERLIINADKRSDHTTFVCVRGGNVLGTSGSVVPLFNKLLKENKPLPITSFGMTRFLLTLADAIGLLVEAAVSALGGEIYVLRMPACRIVDLAEAMKEKYGLPHLELREIGIRPGEKLHEELLTLHEAERTYNLYDRFYVILSEESSPQTDAYYSRFPKAPPHEYTSSSPIISRQEINAMLKKGGLYD